MLHLEIQRGKVRYIFCFNNSLFSLSSHVSPSSLSSYITTIVSQAGMKDTRYQKKYGATTACTVRMGGSVVSANPSHKDTLYGDSWFASCKTAEAVHDELGCHFVGHVKTAHRRFPKEWLEKTMEDWPGGTHIVLESCFGQKNLIAIGYKYNSRKVCLFICTRGAGLTCSGDPYMAKFLTDLGNYNSREVTRPMLASHYFGNSNGIDVNNQIRQALFALEEHWKTHDGWFRCVTTVLGIVATNTFIACQYSFASESEYSSLKVKDFSSVLAYQLSQYPFPDTASFGRSIVRPGQDAPQWYEKIPGRFNPNSIQADIVEALSNVTIDEQVCPILGNTRLKPGWNSIAIVEAVNRPSYAPVLPCDITNSHKQTKIKVHSVDGKRTRPPQCKMCNFHAMKQKKPPFLCVDCGDFFCHDFERGSNGLAPPRQCYWAHMCYIFKNSGIPTAGWCSTFDVWNRTRVDTCKEFDDM